MTGDGDRGESTSVTERIATRREVLAALGGASILSSTTSSTTDVGGGDVHVRVYPGTMPTTGWARYRWRGLSSGWAPPYEDAIEAVRGAFEQVLVYANGTGRLEGVDVVVERGGQVDLSLASISSPREAVSPTQQQLLDAFRDELRERAVASRLTSHLLLWWGPLHYAVGYGGTRRPTRHVDAVEDEGAHVVANVGATETWDSRAVTRNMAIHEVLHTFLASPVVDSVIGSRCDHNLGRAVRQDDRTLEVSPMATAYAGPNEVGGGTRFHGTACYDHDAFYRHDGYAGVDRWRYTTTLSEATLEAVTRYLEHRVVGRE